jgi:hypothetical protein
MDFFNRDKKGKEVPEFPLNTTRKNYLKSLDKLGLQTDSKGKVTAKEEASK